MSKFNFIIGVIFGAILYGIFSMPPGVVTVTLGTVWGIAAAVIVGLDKK